MSTALISIALPQDVDLIASTVTDPHLTIGIQHRRFHQLVQIAPPRFHRPHQRRMTLSGAAKSCAINGMWCVQRLVVFARPTQRFSCRRKLVPPSYPMVIRPPSCPMAMVLSEDIGICCRSLFGGISHARDCRRFCISHAHSNSLG